MIPWPDASDERRTGFNLDVPRNGYAWWYVDAISDDGREGLTIIAFIGSVFSPYYAFARRRAPADPLDHCALNVALYRPGGKTWTMTERGRGRVARNVHSFLIGPSDLGWDGKALTINIRERSAPIPGRIEGRVRVTPQAITKQVFVLNPDGNHRWWPIAPRSRIEVDLRRPDLSWRGEAYLDTNAGDAPIETGFKHWEWARGALRDKTAILYEAERRDGSRIDLAMTFDAQGNMQPFTPPPLLPLARSGWKVARSARSETDARLLRTLEDTPFYARSMIDTTLLGEPVTLMHESLSLDRFKMPVVQAMLPFRMPRRK
ncbi:carotenoid 1,2-hydratase [Rhodopseudomonas sp. B29]|uniref:carotenoid 1,2-hydratase n=1 Tax=Rhodopseudomonas sp. B29 TaxID=95607 RepID=UPI00034D2039|nr:carotenoid 1,2-hydratase [Rhodopseudomonas sp. B29]